MILTITANPTVDKGFHVKRIVKNEKLRAEHLRRDPGGGGINVSRVIKRLGGETAAYALAGGTTGELLAKLLRREKIPFHLTGIEDETRINFTVTEDSAGHQLRFLMPGPKVKQSEWRRFIRDIISIKPIPQLCVLSGSLPPGVPHDFYFRMIQVFKKKGIKCLLDAGGKPLRAGMRAGPDIVKPNLRELGQLVEKKLNSRKLIHQAAFRMLKCGCKMIIISMGDKGAMLVTKEKSLYALPPKVEPVSVVGAGDSMVAGMALKIAQGGSLSEILRFGVAAGTSAVLSPGTELCTRKEFKKVLPEVKISSL
ncbi:MAG: 1-phosphofructokinase family hexose kinase [candidate division Zixibacteria bacterium]|nr:1-phosphofructokinase family hexose kinase [candidate division Zixibacteria bacterium]